jgi:hypothetical protein
MTITTTLPRLCLLALLAVGSAWAEPAWETVTQGRQRGEVSSYVREVPGHDVKSFKGVVETPLPMTAILAVLADLNNLPNWVFQCERSRHDLNWPDVVYYLEFHTPWPVNNREAVLRNTVSQDPQTLVVTINTVAIQGYVGASRGRVRIPELNNRFLIEPLKDGGTRVSFETLVDPGGAIPAWVSNWIATSAPKETLTALLKQAMLPQYRHRKAEAVRLPGLPDLVAPSGPGGK